jgi:cystine transport system permease protein
MAHFLSVFTTHFPEILRAGLIYTIPLSLICFALGFLFAMIVALLQVANVKVFKQICQFYVWVFRGTPMMVQLFIIFFGLPSIGLTLGPIPSAIIGLTLNMGAYMSETLRGSILSIPVGQSEAGFACGMTYLQVMIHIILPQAIKNAVPVLFNHFISLVKDTSLVASITVPEMFMVTQRITALNYEPLIMYIEVAFIYLLFCTVLNLVQNVIEKSLYKKGGQVA